jgi:hypothetical protein
MNVLKATLALTGAPVWIVVNQIVSMTVNKDGGAVITTTEGKQQAIKETPKQVLETIDALMQLERLQT